MYTKYLIRNLIAGSIIVLLYYLLSCSHTQDRDPNSDFADMKKYDNPNNLYRYTVCVTNDSNPSQTVEAIVMIIDDQGNALVATNNDGISFDTIKRPYREYQRIFDEVVYQHLYKVYTPYMTTFYFDVNRGKPQVFYKLLK